MPSLRGLLAPFATISAPPVDTALEMIQPDRFGHRIGFLTFGHAVLVEPDVRGGSALLEEQQIGADRGIGLKYRIGQADDGVEVALLHQMFLEPRLDALAEQRAIGQHHGGAAI